MKWALVEKIPAMVIGSYDDQVVLECLIDKDHEIYEEREFSLSLFVGYDLNIGDIFNLCFYSKPNQSLLKIKIDTRKSAKNSFLKIDFVKEFFDIRLEK